MTPILIYIDNVKDLSTGHDGHLVVEGLGVVTMAVGMETKLASLFHFKESVAKRKNERTRLISGYWFIHGKLKYVLKLFYTV